MAVPKKKISRSRRDMRRYSASYRLPLVTICSCPSCKKPIEPHKVCHHCGFYKAKKVLNIAT